MSNHGESLTKEQIARIEQQSAYATACLTMVTLHVWTASGDRFTVAAFPWEWLETARHLSALRDVQSMFATHISLDPDQWWRWERPVRGKARKAA